MVVLVTGGSGQLGQALQAEAFRYPSLKILIFSAIEADITDRHRLQHLFEHHRPNYCINAAAYTAVDNAESHPVQAYKINADAAGNLAFVCRSYGTTLIHLSTDFVFDGRKNFPYNESDLVNPLNVYGKSKYEGEQAVAHNCPAHIILRTSWLYSGLGSNFLRTMLRLAKENDTISVVDDQIGTPTHALDLAGAIFEIIIKNRNEYGIFHFSNEGATSWYGFASEIFAVNNIAVKVRPISTKEFPTSAQRPRYSVLSKSKITETFGLQIDTWQAALKKHI